MKRIDAQYARVFNRDRWKCVYCGYDGNGETKCFFLEVDHLDPTTKTEDDFDPEFDDNKVTACTYCNKKKARYQPKGVSREEKLCDAKAYLERQRQMGVDWFKRYYRES